MSIGSHGKQGTRACVANGELRGDPGTRTTPSGSRRGRAAPAPAPSRTCTWTPCATPSSSTSM
jgi:hypothetical protein